jgi:hypothetical protein
MSRVTKKVTLTAAQLAKKGPSEHQMQAEVIFWAALNKTRHPVLHTLFAVPNGGTRPWKVDRKGRRYSPVSQRLKAEGAQAGVPDLCLPVARGGYIGLWIEMKRKPNKQTFEQILWMNMLRKQGHVVELCWSAAEAISVLEAYLKLPNRFEVVSRGLPTPEEFRRTFIAALGQGRLP